ncbi:ATP-binding cassette domain-containing protein [Pelistega sp. NLN82]|uniref:ATP-binding cassette domain-containing protein n=1 Tax=Pelistega ratti TaxID=2652177 RepID=A0A6L9Y671_9BURK|nr:ATP-binding cassette domain-containing protein [Pelistega ratti]NEN75308.1 ATP-binding cassette domain-containing protein [Pelistega ratti]
MITTQDLSKYYGKKAILKNLTVEIPSQKITALIGPNGAGKSTLLMMLAKLLNPTCGHIFFNDQDIAHINIATYARQVATLTQSPEFNLRLKVEDLVAYGRFPYSRGQLTHKDKKIVQESIQFLGLNAIKEAYLDEISGGQRQMAFIAMVVAQQTEILLLDEPLNNLDMKHSSELMKRLRCLCDEQGKTVVIVIHDINFAAIYADHVIALKKGELFFNGAMEYMITQEKLSQLYDMYVDILKRNQNGFLCDYF